MTKYKAKITKTSDVSFYAIIFRIDSDREERVIHSYKSRHFKTQKAAERSTASHIAKLLS